MANAMKKWELLSGDVNWEDYGAMWVRQDPGNARVYFVLRFENLIECMGERDVKESGLDQYLCTVYRVDLDDQPEDQIKGALDCCGIDLADLDPEYHELALVECLVSYGAAAPMGEHSNPHYANRARAAARRDAESMMSSPTRTKRLLNRPVNALGSTAAEYARGDIHSAMTRGVLAGDTEARLMARMGGVDQAVIDDVTPSDILPYTLGYMTGLNDGTPEAGKGIAPEYHLGYRRGVNVREGKAPPPARIKHRG